MAPPSARETLAPDEGGSATWPDPASGQVESAVAQPAGSSEPPGAKPVADEVTLETPGRYQQAQVGTDGVLGTGGMGVVSLVVDRHLERVVARKALYPGRATLDAPGQPGSATRFIREARVAANLEHPGIVPVYELGRASDGTLYYTMRRVEGRTLTACLQDCRTLAQRLSLLGHFVDMCHALAYAHSRGILHRDIKPQNVMIGPFGETIVLDWGLARVVGQPDSLPVVSSPSLKPSELEGRTADGSVFGTPSYMSPEQARGELSSMDERSEVWSLGAVLYELLTGRPPFTGVNALAVVAQVQSLTVPAVRDRCPGVPPELAAIADKALLRDPGLRYQSARALAGDIEAWQNGDRVSAHAYAPRELLARFIRRHRALLGVIAAATLALGVFGGLSVLRIVAERDRAIRAEGEALQSLRLAEIRGLVAYAFRSEGEGRDSDALAYFRAAAALEVPSVRLTAARAGMQRLSRPGAAVRVLDPGAGPLTGLALADEGRGLEVISLRGERFAWDLATGASVPPGGGSIAAWREDAMEILAPSPDGRFRARGDAKGVVTVQDTRGPLVVRLVAHTEGIQSLAWSRDGRLLAAGGLDKTATVWEVPGGRLVATFSHRGPVSACAFSPDGTRLATGSWDATNGRVWDIATGSLITMLRGHTHWPVAMTWSADGQTLFTASRDGTARLWDLSDLGVFHPSQEVSVDRASGVLQAPAPGGGRGVGDSKAGGVSWSVRPRCAPISGSEANQVTHTPDGTVQVSRGSAVQRISAHVGEVLGTCLFQGGRVLLTTGSDCHARVWSVPDLSLRSDLFAPADGVVDFGFGPSEAQVVTLSGSGHPSVRTWDLETGLLLQTRDPYPPPRALHVSTDGQTVLVETESGVWSYSAPWEEGSLESSGRLTNLRVCRSTLEILPVQPWPDPVSTWAPCGEDGGP